MNPNNLGDIMHPQQLKNLISSLKQLGIQDYISPTWLKQDQALQKLNMQLHINAIMKNDQFILEQFVSQEKFDMLIVDLIVTYVWKKKVLPSIINKGSTNNNAQHQLKQYNSLKIYLSIYHEAVVCNMLEVMFYYATAVVQSKQYLIQIINYCQQKITRQIGKNAQKRKLQREKQKKNKNNVNSNSNNDRDEQDIKKQKLDKILKRTPVQQFENQIQQIQFSTFIMCLSIVKYITDYIGKLEIGIVHHLIIQSNIFALLVPLLEDKPWLRTNAEGQRQIFENNKWNLVPKNQYGRLPKSQGQVWLTLYNLFGNPQCMKKYELNDQRKNTLLRLRKFMNEVLLDQIPALAHMLRSLEHLSMTTVPSQLSSNPFVVQQVPIVSSQLQNISNWNEIIQQHKQKLKKNLDQTERDHMQKLAQLYSNENVSGLLDGFKCGKCSKQAFKRCSKCKSIWYCSRECQVSDWPNHKVACNKKVQQLKQQQKSREIIIPSAGKPTLIDELD